MIIILLGRGEGQLTENFYNTTCPNVESIVAQVVATKITQTFVTIPATLRLFFHDCFVEVSLSKTSYWLSVINFLPETNILRITEPNRVWC